MREAIQRYLLERLPDPKAAPRPELAQYARLLRDYPERGGKLLRGQLLLATAQAHGAPPERALPAAAALELFQNWVLIHDDIEDASEMRRGRPTLHRLYGVPLALNAGDALHAVMWRVLLEAAYPTPVLQEFARLVETTARGQHLDLTWIEAGRFDLSPEDYLEMVRQKAAYYTAVAPLKLGALVAGHAPHPAFEPAGLKLGVAFQIIDDVLNLEGDPDKYGKEIAGDLREGKRTLILLHFLAGAAPAERARAEALLKTPAPQKDPAELAWLHARLRDTGAVAYAREVARRLAREGLDALTPVLTALPDPKAGQAVLELLKRLVEREA